MSIISINSKNFNNLDEQTSNILKENGIKIVKATCIIGLNALLKLENGSTFTYNFHRAVLDTRNKDLSFYKGNQSLVPIIILKKEV